MKNGKEGGRVKNETWNENERERESEVQKEMLCQDTGGMQGNVVPEKKAANRNKNKDMNPTFSPL